MGLGESKGDRIRLLQMLANQNPHPESVPINKLVPVVGTPLGDRMLRASEHVPNRAVPVWGGGASGPASAKTDGGIGGRAVSPPNENIEWIRTIATARILMPQSMIRLSAGRTSLSDEAQALTFMAGANSIFAGDKLLTTPNPDWDQDAALFAQLGLKEMPLLKTSI